MNNYSLAFYEASIGSAYHLHEAGRHWESYDQNKRLAEFASEIGNLDLAERCYKRAIDDAQKLNLPKEKINRMLDFSRNVLIKWLS